MRQTFHRSWLLHLLIFSILSGGCGAASAPQPAQLSSPVGPEAALPDAAFQAALSGEEAMAGAPAPAGVERKIIARASMTLVVADTEEAVDQITGLVSGLGGYVANANLYKSSYGEGEVLQGTLTLRVPADQTDQALAQLEALAVDVGAKNLNREDVTDQYTDLSAQLRNLEAAETELRALLAEVRAKPDATPEDILTVHRSVTEIRGQIDQLQGRKNMLDNLIGLATIDVTLTPDVLNRPVVDEGWRPAVVVRDALRNLVNTLEVLGTVAIWLGIYLLPLALMVLIVLSAVVWVLRLLLRRLQRKNRLATS